MNYENIETPAVLINEVVVEKNIEREIALAKQWGKKLRPHIKTHKCVHFAKMQTASYSTGICTAKISEAEVMADAGIKDILIANEVVGEGKLNRLVNLARRVDLSVLVDSEDVLDPLIKITDKEDVHLSVLIELDQEDHRCGTDIDTGIVLARKILESKNLKFKGIELFGGFVFHTSNATMLENNAKSLEEFIRKALEQFSRENIKVEEVSVGGSPAFERLLQISTITELRPGVYIFNDGATVSRNGAEWEDCALSVLTTVISINKKEHYAVLDGGAKTFSYCCPGVVFGNKILHGVWKDNHKAIVSGLSEEHGILDLSALEENSICVGDRLEIIPSHACPVVNLTDDVYVFGQDGQISKKKIDARGKTW